MSGKILNVFLVVILILGFCSFAYALSSYKTQFNTRYGTTGTTLDQCLLCHTSNSNVGPVNSYGNAFGNSNHNFVTIEQLDSDSDGFNNLAEITARTFPGNASSKPASNPAPSPPGNLRKR